MTLAPGYRHTSHDLVVIFPTWSCMSCHKLLRSHLVRHFHYLNQSRTFLVVCPVSCCWPVSIHFQSLQSIATDDGKRYQCQNILFFNNKGKDWQNLFAITRFRYIEVRFHTFCYYCGKENCSLYRGSTIFSIINRMSFNC